MKYHFYQRMKKIHWWLVIVFVVALFLRTYKLASLPSGFQNDEASFLYNTQILLETGRDEDGRSWPLYLLSYIDPKPALISYLQMPFVLIIDNAVLASRMPGALLGTLSLLLLWWWLSVLGVPRRLQLIMISLLAVSPWHIMASRSTQEVIVSFFFGIATFLALEYFLKSMRLGVKNTQKLFLSLVFLVLFVLTIYTYHSAKIILPLLVFLILSWHGWWHERRKELLLIGIFMILLIGGVIASNSQGFKRFSDVGLFSSSDMDATLTEQITLSTPHSSPFFIRFFHNKAVYLTLLIGKTYCSHLTASFLFFSGGEPRRYALPFHGLFYHIEFVWLVAGFVVSLRRTKKSRHMTWLFMAWLALAPLPAAITTQEVPSVIRSFWMIVPLYYFIAIGIEWWCLHMKFKKTILLVVLLGGYLWGFAYAWHQWAVFQPLYHPWNRNVADEEMVQKLTLLRPIFDEVVISRFSGQPYIYLALARLINSQTLQLSYPLRLEDVFTIGEYTFVPGDCPLEKKAGVLFVVREKCPLPLGFQMIDRAPYRDGNDGYMFVVWDE